MLREHYDHLFPLNKHRLSFLLHICKENGVERILDVGCSTGTYTLELKERGYEAAGMDLDDGMIRKAKEKAKERGLAPSFFKGDMLALHQLICDTFHLITCCGNTLPHLHSPAEIQRALLEMSQSLTAEGLLVAQTVNYDKALEEGITSLPTIVREGLSFERRYTFSEEYILFQGILTTERGRAESVLPLYPIKKAEMEEWMVEAGFTDLSFYHDFQYTPFSYEEGAPLGMVVVGRRGA